MLYFIAGLLVGTVAGFFIAALCSVAHSADAHASKTFTYEPAPAQDTPTDVT